MTSLPKNSPRGRVPTSLLPWVEARKRHHLSHAHVQMARELGLNPAKLGKLDNHRQEPWEAPLPEFIEHIYFKRFGRACRTAYPERVIRTMQAINIAIVNPLFRLQILTAAP